MPHDPMVNNEQKDEHPVPLELSRAKYIILRWMAGIFLLVVASALWWWPRYVDVHPQRTQEHASSAIETESPTESSIILEDQGVIARLAAMEEKLQALEKNPLDTTLEGEVGQPRMNPEIWTELKGTTEQKVASLKALFKIERAIHQGQPFKEMFQTFKSEASWLLSVSSALSVLESVAEGGAPTLRHLQTHFDDSKGMKAPFFDALRLNHMVDILLSLIHIEKISDNKGTMLQDKPLLTALMDAGAVAEVVQSIDALDSAEHQVYDAWLMQAKLYLAVQEAFDVVLAQAIAQPVRVTKSEPSTPNNNNEIQTGVSQ